MIRNPNPDSCPENIRNAFIAYRDRGIPPGDFVRACLENNLKEAFIRADENNRYAMPHIVAWLYWEMPRNLWGNPEVVGRHLITKLSEAHYHA